MLQRRIGMICTRSGCAVCTSPRMNSRAERAFRFRLAVTIGSRRRFGRTKLPHVLADLQRAPEERADGNEPEELVPADRGEAGRGNAPTVGAIGRAAELTRGDSGPQIGGDGRRGPRENTLVWRF